MITLYYRPQTSGRPMRVAWLLEELGVEYDAVAVPDTETPEHLERQPLGRVPVVTFDDGETLFDSTAILFAIADRHPDAGFMGPLGSRERDLNYQWSLTGQTELEKAALGVLLDQDADGSRELYGAATAALGDALEGRDYLAGDSLGIADIVTVGVLYISQREKLVTEVAPSNVQKYFETVGARPALARAAQRTESLLQPAELLPG